MKNIAVSLAKNSTIVRINKKAVELLPGVVRVVSSVLPETSSHLAQKLFFRTPPRVALTRDEKEFLATGHPGQITVNGKTIKLWTWGTGPTVMVVHGWGSRAGRLQALLEQLVHSGYSVLTFDAAGHGDSEGNTTSVVEQAQVIRELARWATSVYGVIGHSFGGAALALALKQGLHVERAVLVAAPARMDEYFDYFKNKIGLSDRSAEILKNRVEKMVNIKLDDLNIAGFAPSLAAPALIVHDRNDRDVDFEEGQLMAKNWPQAEFLETKGLGHHRVVRAPEVIARILAFLGEKNRLSQEGTRLRRRRYYQTTGRGVLLL